ncbi:FUSC family protein [Paenibacillus shenyangensis]|uniref:FUSC family protein n=1 Tax=Paenibacillus sp. A9 TaxID=1284352 RepID=UPI0003735AA1|nr:aromatic acid exporter family protein [Paenibacillus sp. A9]
MKFAIGMRNLKTALAVLICLIISQLLHLEYPFYAVIATIIAMENSVTNSYTVGKNRMMGTIVGAFCGLIFALIDPHNAILAALGIIMVIYICNLLGWNKSVSIASIVFLAIMLNLRPGESPLLYGTHRVMDTLIGIGVAVLVNYLVYPPNHERGLEQKRMVLRRNMTRLAHELLREGGGVHISSLRDDMTAMEEAYKTYTSEFRLNLSKQLFIDHIEQEIDIYHNTYSHMRMLRLLTDEPETELAPGVIQRLRSLVAAPITVHPEYLPLIYQYHVQCIIQEMQILGLMIPAHIAPPKKLQPIRTELAISDESVE